MPARPLTRHSRILMTYPPVPDDARAARTQRQIFEAFADLVQRERYDAFAVSDIVKEAGIGRSTFYEHFRDKDSVLRMSLRFPFGPLANLFFQEEAEERVVFALDHLWDRRALARIILSEPTRSIAVQTLIDLAEEGASARGLDPTHGPLRAEIAFKASGAIAALENWVTGRLQMTAEALASSIFCHDQMRLSLAD